jgi:predicted nuclease with TOPRIM domain
MRAMRKMTVQSVLAMAALGTAVILGGCGQEIKKENEQLKAQVGTLQKENADLKGQLAAAKADAEKTKADVENVTKELQAKTEELQQMMTKRGPAKAPAKR